MALQIIWSQEILPGSCHRARGWCANTKYARVNSKLKIKNLVFKSPTDKGNKQVTTLYVLYFVAILILFVYGCLVLSSIGSTKKDFPPTTYYDLMR